MLAAFGIGAVGNDARAQDYGTDGRRVVEAVVRSLSSEWEVPVAEIVVDSGGSGFDKGYRAGPGRTRLVGVQVLTDAARTAGFQIGSARAAWDCTRASEHERGCRLRQGREFMALQAPTLAADSARVALRRILGNRTGRPSYHMEAWEAVLSRDPAGWRVERLTMFGVS